MACQEDAPTAVGGPSDKAAQRADMPNGMLEYLPPAPQMTPNADMTGLGGSQPLIDLDEIEAWTFENWSFNPADLQQVLADPYPSTAI
jgi:hypothetical protein